MTARTQVGIVEWARRIESARATEMGLAEALAARVAEAPDAGTMIDLVRRARRHAWHADLWKSIAPVLHNLSVDAAAPSGIQIDADPESVLERLDEVYGAWQAEASLVAEAPIMRVLEVVGRDHDGGAAG